MNMYMDKLSRFVPVIRQKQLMLTEQGPKIVLAKMNYMPDGNYYNEIPYLQELENISDEITLEREKRIFLVTEEDNIAIKTAYNYLTYPVYELRDEIWEHIEKQQPDLKSRIMIHDQNGDDITLRIISMHGEKRVETSNLIYPLMNSGVSEDTFVFYNGLEETSNLEAKLDVILTSPARIQFVQVSEEQLGTPWLRNLMMDKEYEMLVLSKTSDRYYIHVLEQLMDGERYKLEAGLTPEQLVRSIRKKCTCKFREEDLAWSLDQAAKKARTQGRSILQYSDFSLEKSDTEPTLKKLEKMTGLTEMKQTAMEYAALSREQTKNEKIEKICKHIIYVGAPGTGKTECGKLLAKIMSEEGQSNGNFIAASRKDIIGEHVGSTAPKVADLFQKSRHGVLFVDEAGFLLHGPKASFNNEAIKEFVRYMELYQDITVVFALYPHEVEDWMQLDAGLSSRIGRIVKFENYTVTELIQIGQSMCLDRGYQMAQEAIPEITSYLKNRMQVLKEKFGNAREIRKLTEAAIIAKSVRCFGRKSEKPEVVLCREDFLAAIARLSLEKAEKKRVIGFSIGGNSDE